MINEILFLLLRASISASLSDREAFISRVAGIIEDKTGKDPEAARRISDGIAGAMEGLNGDLLLRQLLTSKQNKRLNQSLDKLTEAVQRLNSLLEEIEPSAAPKTEEQ